MTHPSNRGTFSLPSHSFISHIASLQVARVTSGLKSEMRRTVRIFLSVLNPDYPWESLKARVHCIPSSPGPRAIHAYRPAIAVPVVVRPERRIFSHPIRRHVAMPEYDNAGMETQEGETCFEGNLFDDGDEADALWALRDVRPRSAHAPPPEIQIDAYEGEEPEEEEEGYVSMSATIMAIAAAEAIDRKSVV